NTVYAAIFDSGNGTTILGGGNLANNVLNFPPNVVSNANGPYGGVNPPPNAPVAPETPGGFQPPINPFVETVPPKVGLIVRLDDAGVWRDENGTDWTSFVTGPQASLSGRQMGWTLLDNDIAVIDA